MKSKIEWTESTWNPITGCSKISAGCKNCYAERMAKRLHAMGQYNYRNGFRLTIHEHMLHRPFSWKKPQMIFVNSMSDLFHEEAPKEFISKVFETMNRANLHTYQVLTKRAEKLASLSCDLPWSDNIWMGTTVENADYKHRIQRLKETPAKIKFLSLEPLLGSLGELDLNQIDWVIVGGESGPGSRPMELSWVKEIRDQCIESRTPFFFKQWGGTRKKNAGRSLEGRTWNEMPTKYEAA